MYLLFRNFMNKYYLFPTIQVLNYEVMSCLPKEITECVILVDKKSIGKYKKGYNFILTGYNFCYYIVVKIIDKVLGPINNIKSEVPIFRLTIKSNSTSEPYFLKCKILW